MTLASDNALRLLRESRDGARIFEPGEVERLARLAGVAVEYVRVNLATGEATVQRIDLAELTVQRVTVAAPGGARTAVEQ